MSLAPIEPTHVRFHRPTGGMLTVGGVSWQGESAAPEGAATASSGRAWRRGGCRRRGRGEGEKPALRLAQSALVQPARRARGTGGGGGEREGDGGGALGGGAAGGGG